MKVEASFIRFAYGEGAHARLAARLSPRKGPMRMPILAVVVPAHNEESSLPLCLSSLASQTRKPDEVIVVDDRSTDRTFDAASRFPFHVVRRTGAGGYDILDVYSRVVYFGVQQLKSDWDYLGILDADTILEPQYYEKLIPLIDASPEVGIGGGELYPYHKTIGTRDWWASKRTMGLLPYVYGCNRVYTRSCWETLWKFTVPRFRSYMGFSLDTYHYLLAESIGIRVRKYPDVKSWALRDPNVRANVRQNRGMASYVLGYYPWYLILRIIRNLDPKLLTGYVQAWRSRFEELQDVKPYVRYLQRKRITRLIGRVLTGS